MTKLIIIVEQSIKEYKFDKHQENINVAYKYRNEKLS